MRKRIFIICASILLVLMLFAAGYGNKPSTIDIAWDAPIAKVENVAGYIIKFGMESDSYLGLVTVDKSRTRLSGLPFVRYYCIQTLDISGNLSVCAMLDTHISR